MVAAAWMYDYLRHIRPTEGVAPLFILLRGRSVPDWYLSSVDQNGSELYKTDEVMR